MGEETFLCRPAPLLSSAGSPWTWWGSTTLYPLLDDASGGDWEAFLTDWLFNVADYYVESYTLDSID